MRLDDKARENLEACERLLPDATGDLEALSNASAARGYYAAYQAIVDRALRAGHVPTSRGEAYFRHDELPNDAARWGLLEEVGREDLSWLRDLRIKADYFEDRVDLEEASEALEVATQIVRRALGDPGGASR